MNNANSLYNKYSRYIAGGISEVADNRIDWWERGNLAGADDDTIYVVENFYEGRLDLIASVFYNEPRWWWIIAQYNSVLDPFGEILAGRVLLLPAKERIMSMISTKKGGIQSKKQPINSISPVII